MDNIPPSPYDSNNNEKSRSFAKLIIGMKLFMDGFASLGLYGQNMVNNLIDQNPELSAQIRQMKETACEQPFPFPDVPPVLLDDLNAPSTASNHLIDFESIRNLTPALKSPKAQRLWTNAYMAGVVDRNLQPMLEFDSEMAIFANVFNQALGCNKKGRWLPFERLWHKKSLSKKFNNVFGCAKYDELVTYFKDIIHRG